MLSFDVRSMGAGIVSLGPLEEFVRDASVCGGAEMYDWLREVVAGVSGHAPKMKSSLWVFGSMGNALFSYLEPRHVE